MSLSWNTMVATHLIFIYINLRDKQLAKRIVEELEDRNIYIRGNWPPPYETGICVTGATEDIMQKFISDSGKF